MVQNAPIKESHRGSAPITTFSRGPCAGPGRKTHFISYPIYSVIIGGTIPNTVRRSRSEKPEDPSSNWGPPAGPI